MSDGEWRTCENPECPDGWGPDCFPAGNASHKHFYPAVAAERGGTRIITARQAFEEACAASRDITVPQLRARGMHAVPCTCGADICRGWALETTLHE